MARIFLSHSSRDNAPAIALRDWLISEGWDDLFLDFDPERGIGAGARWERALSEAARRCEAVLFLVSRNWLASGWCVKEFHLAAKLNKRLFGILIEPIPLSDLPPDLLGDWQLVDLASGNDHRMFRSIAPDKSKEEHVTFSASGLQRLKAGLTSAGLDPRYFAWPPDNDPDRSPYRGLKALETEDAGIFFGREAPIVEALDRLRGLRDAARPRLMVILGASGAGKSSFVRAGLVPRMKRDDRHFLLLPVIRPERAGMTGETGLIKAVAQAMTQARLPVTRVQVAAAAADDDLLAGLLERLAEAGRPPGITGDSRSEAPTLVLIVDQGEELFLPDGKAEADLLLARLRHLLMCERLQLIVLIAIRSDAYDQLQSAPALDGMGQQTFSLPPMPRGAYGAVIDGPAQRLAQSGRALKIEPALTQALLRDIETGGGKDALPLLAFTLERLFLDHGGDGDLTLDEYRLTGGVKGSIEAAIEKALVSADSDPRLPKDRAARLVLLRRALIPWLAGIDPETNTPRRRVARLSEIVEDARPMVEHLVAVRLLSTDTAETGEVTIEPAHEALLRQWSLLQGWLADDTPALSALHGVRDAAREWEANQRLPDWLAHAASRLRDAERFAAMPRFAGYLDDSATAYLKDCRRKARTRQLRDSRLQIAVAILLVFVLSQGLLWWKFKEVSATVYWALHARPSIVSDAGEHALADRTTSFRECTDCPDMLVVRPGRFTRGGPLPIRSEKSRERPITEVTIGRHFAVSETEITHGQWNVCVKYGACRMIVLTNTDLAGDPYPVVNITWNDAKTYAAWLSHLTGKTYRLLSEAEWEYVARAGTTGHFSFKDDSRAGDYAWYGLNSEGRPHPVKTRLPNAFGVHDIHGNVAEWVEDCFAETYDNAATDGSARTSPDCLRRVKRGGDWLSTLSALRSATRDWQRSEDASDQTGFRLARQIGP